MAVLKIKVNRDHCQIEAAGDFDVCCAELITAVHSFFVHLKEADEKEAERIRDLMRELINSDRIWSRGVKKMEKIIEVDKPEDFWEDGWPIGGGDR